jgi:hypothetical protein
MALKFKKRKRTGGEIPTASMADIAFLDEQEPPPVNARNMLKILVNEVGQILMEDKPSSVALIRAEVKKHVTNNGVDPNYSESPTQSVISIKTSSQTPYESYIDVLDETWMGYFEIWDAEARRLGYPDYVTYAASLGEDDVNEVRETYPAAISIAEPDPQN